MAGEVFVIQHGIGRHEPCVHNVPQFESIKVDEVVGLNDFEYSRGMC